MNIYNLIRNYLNFFYSTVLICCLGIFLITGCSSGGDGSDGNSVNAFDEIGIDSDFCISDFGSDYNGFWVSRSNFLIWTYYGTDQPLSLIAGVNFQEMSTSRENNEINTGENFAYYYHSDGTISISWSYGSVFGPRGNGFHNGIDYGSELGDIIIAPADGIVSDAYYNMEDGNVLIVSHTSSIRSIYAHLDSFLVSKNEKVKRGQAIAVCGGTGGPPEMEPHLHFQVNRGPGWGESTDPRNYWYGGYGTPEVFEESKSYPSDNAQLTLPIKPLPYKSFNGIISPDQNFIILADTDLLDGVTRIMAGIKWVPGLDESVLNGEYVFTRLIGMGPDMVKSEILDFQFDGSGSLEYSVVQTDDNIQPSITHDTYFITENEGDYTNLWSDSSGSGAVSSEGDIFTFSNMDTLSFGVGVKKSFNRTVDELEGSYIVLTFMHEGGIVTQRSECEFSNYGNYECVYMSTPQYNDEIVQGKCNVEQDGVIACDQFLGGEGAINKNGDIFTLVSSNDSEGTTSFSIGVKKSGIVQ